MRVDVADGLMVFLVLMVLRVFIEGGVAVDRLERLLVRGQHLTSGPIDTTLEEIVMDTADIRNNKQNNHLLKGNLIIFTENHATSPPVYRCHRCIKKLQMFPLCLKKRCIKGGK
jgi:hypothetical protein